MSVRLIAVGALLLGISSFVSAANECRCDVFPFLPSPPCPRFCNTLLFDKADIEVLKKNLKLSSEEADSLRRYRFVFGLTEPRSADAASEVSLTAEDVVNLERVQLKLSELSKDAASPLIESVPSRMRVVPISDWPYDPKGFETSPWREN